MMTRPKKVVANMLSSPLHAIVDLDLLTTGMILLTHRHYFFWPPWPSWITAVELKLSRLPPRGTARNPQETRQIRSKIN